MEGLHPERAQEEVEAERNRSAQGDREGEVRTGVVPEDLEGQHEPDRQERTRPEDVAVYVDGVPEAVRVVLEPDDVGPVIRIEAGVRDVGAEYGRGEPDQHAGEHE